MTSDEDLARMPRWFRRACMVVLLPPTIVADVLGAAPFCCRLLAIIGRGVHAKVSDDIRGDIAAAKRWWR